MTWASSWTSPIMSSCWITARRSPKAHPTTCVRIRSSFAPTWAGADGPGCEQTDRILTIHHAVFLRSLDRGSALRNHVLARGHRVRADLQGIGRVQLCAGLDGVLRGADLR